MEEIKYFFDSYAVIELLKENPAYERFEEEEVIITVFNLAEIYWHVLLADEKNAEMIYEKFKKGVVSFDDEVLKEAIKFRKANKKKNLSYADCVGYIYAKKHNMKFLTGDKEFQHLENVEFMK